MRAEEKNMGSMSDILGDMNTFTHTDFRTGKSYRLKTR